MHLEGCRGSLGSCRGAPMHLGGGTVGVLMLLRGGLWGSFCYWRGGDGGPCVPPTPSLPQTVPPSTPHCHHLFISHRSHFTLCGVPPLAPHFPWWGCPREPNGTVGGSQQLCAMGGTYAPKSGSCPGGGDTHTSGCGGVWGAPLESPHSCSARGAPSWGVLGVRRGVSPWGLSPALPGPRTA